MSLRKHLSVGVGRRQVYEDSTLCSFTIDFEKVEVFKGTSGNTCKWSMPFLVKIKPFETICIRKVELRLLLLTNLENPVAFANAKPSITSLVNLRVFFIGDGGMLKLNYSPKESSRSM